MYTGVTDLDSFEKCLELSRHVIVYNGDIISASQFQEMSKRFKIKKWMIGRGALRNPFLPDEIKSGKEIPIEEKYSRLKHFHDEIFSEYSNKIENKTHILDRMKGQWFYLGSFFDYRKKELKKIKKTSSIKKYLEETEIIFSNQKK
jgi:tRNA-dihydrouridine synthase